MAITIGSNTISSNTTDINFYRSSTNLLTYNVQFGKIGTYCSFYACNNDSNWRYSGQLGGTGGWREASTWSGASWSVTQRGQGSYGFNTGNGRYYAPVTGYYMFGMNFYHGSDNSNSQGYLHSNFLRNSGTGFNGNGRHGHSLFGHDAQSFYTNGCTTENVIFLTQGQYVAPGPYMGGSLSRIYMGHFQFYGHLVP